MRNRVERLWPGATVVLIAGGPSLTVADVEAVRGQARVIVVNTAYQLAPWADALYATDGVWWAYHQTRGAGEFRGLKFSIAVPATPKKPVDVCVLRDTGRLGLELDPTGLRHGKNSGYAAINLAVHLGASRIVLLGYDMKVSNKTHWHGNHPWQMESNRSWLLTVASWPAHYQTLVQPLDALGIEVINASRETALTCFPRVSLAQALRREVAA